VPLVLRHIPAGTFLMGSPVDERGRYEQEDLHQVTLTHDYYLGKYEVTQAQWEAVMGAPAPTVCHEQGPMGVGPEYPVYCVSWDDIAGAGGFVERLNVYLGTTACRLPTEAEWERATRAGTQTRFSYGDVLECGDDCEPCALHDQYAWWCGNSGQSQPVGSRLANAFGLHDVEGNVYELCQDWWTVHLGTSPVTDPTGPTTGTVRIIRGGAIYSWARDLRSAIRTWQFTDDPYVYLGFRIAMTP
jgi:formylglycine-generating enzyme required for sulfatase activity